MTRDLHRRLLTQKWDAFAQRNPHVQRQLIGYLLNVACAIMTPEQVKQFLDQPNPFGVETRRASDDDAGGDDALLQQLHARQITFEEWKDNKHDRR